MSIPNEEECLQLLRKYNTPPQVIDHCKLVTEITKELIAGCNKINNEIAIAGALLHDIGRSVTHSLYHAIEGVKILEQEKINPKIISIVKKHIGTGITKEEAKKLGLPVDDYIPKTAEEIIVSYADNITCGSRRCSYQEALNRFIKKFGKNSHVVRGFMHQHLFIINLKRNCV